MHIDIVIFNRYNHAVTWATRHFISLISIRKKYESNFKEISKLHLLVVIYECTSGQRKHSTNVDVEICVETTMNEMSTKNGSNKVYALIPIRVNF